MIPPDSNDDLVTLTVKPNEFAAAAVVAVLEEADIQAWTFGLGQAALPLGERLIGVPVQVRKVDLARAQDALKQQVADSVDLDWDSVDVGERADDLPLGSPRHMPLVVWLGYWLAIALLVITLLAVVIKAIGLM